MKKLVFAAVLACATSAFAETYTWNGSTSTAAKWTDSANWLVDGQPTDSYPASSADTAAFAEGAVAVFDLALDNAAGGGVKITVGAGAAVTIKSTASAAPTFTCSPTIGANAVMIFDHVKLSGFPASSSTSSRYLFVNGAEYSPGWISGAGNSAGAWVFENSVFGFTDQMPLGQGGYMQDVVLVNTVAGGKNNSKAMTFGKAGWLYATNSVLTLHTNMGYIDISTTTSGQKGMVISGDYCQLSVYQVKAGSGSIMEFDYGRTDRSALTIGAGGFVPDAAAKLVVDVTEKSDELKEVPLITCTGTMTIPEKWLSMDADSVTADEYVKRLYISDDGKTLMATLAKPSTDTAPSGRVVIEDAVAGAHEKAVKAILDDRGVGAESTSITIALYSDAERTLLVRSITAAEDRTDPSYAVTVSFGDLVLDTPYYVRATLSNNLGEEKVIDADFMFQYPLPSGSEFSWCGWGDGVSWTDPANWGVREGYPASSTQTAAFPDGAVAVFDLALDNAAGGGVKITVGAGAAVTIKSTASAAPTFTCAPTVAANGSLTFDHVKFGGANTYLAATSDSSIYRFINGAEYAPGWISTSTGSGGGVWYFEDSTFGFNDQLPLGKDDKYRHDVVLVNTVAGGKDNSKHMVFGKAGWLYVTNSVLTLNTNGGDIDISTTMSGQKGMVISGDDCQLSVYQVKAGSGSIMEFDYGRTDRSALTIGAGGFVPDAAAKLVVRLPESLKRSCEVPLVSCTGTMTIPEGWLALNPESVEAPKQLTGLAVKEVDGVRCLMATFTLNKGMMLILR